MALVVLLSGILLAPALLQYAHAATTNTLTVRTYTTDGDALSMYTVIRSGSITVKSGFTPLTYEGAADGTYSVQVYNYQDLTFSYWGGGNGSNNPRTLTLWGDTTAIAYYTTGSTSSTTSTSDLTVRAYSNDGDVLNMYAVIRSGSTTVETGFTPLTYTGTTGKTYTVTVSDYQDRVFDEWADGSTDNSRTLTLEGDTTAVAYYNTGSTSTSSGSSSSTSITSLIPKTGVIVSLYAYPGSTGSVHWQKVIDEKNEHPSVPIVVIFNPSSGPGSSKSSTFAYWVDKLQDAGVIVVGYIPDGYADTKNPGSRTMTYMKDKIKKYDDWYGADGVYFDEFTNKPGYEDRYEELTEYAKSLGMKITGGNPGTDVPPSYIGTVDFIKTSEGPGYISSTHQNIIGSSWVSGGYSGWHEDYDKRNFSIVRYDISWLSSSFVTEVSEYMGLMYITDGNDEDGRWFSLPSYFDDLVAALDR
ncbi:MAG TPA: spherulation-specific family 4 protein [Nitrososphaera sp.]